MDKIKTIQTRLSRRGVSISREAIRGAIAPLYPEGMEIDIDAATEHILSKPAPKGKESVAITTQEKEEMVVNAAQAIEIDLPIEAIKQIASSIDFAINSRSELLQQLRTAITKWGEEKVREANQLSQKITEETEEIFSEVSGKVNQALQENNRQIEARSQEFVASVNQSVEAFRRDQAKILEIFK